MNTSEKLLRNKEQVSDRKKKVLGFRLRRPMAFHGCTDCGKKMLMGTGINVLDRSGQINPAFVVTKNYRLFLISSIVFFTSSASWALGLSFR